MKGILINPTDKTITWVELTKDYRDIYPLIGNDCQLFECPYVESLHPHNALFCDEEGGFKDNDTFKIWVHNIRGNALILGCNLENGDSKDCTLTIEEITKLVKFT